MYLMRRSRSFLHHGRPCPYCKRPMDQDDRHLQPTRDHHPVPRSKGGRRTIICCMVCNNRKGDMTAAEWQAYMNATPEWWKLTKRDRKRIRAEKRTERWGARESDADLYRGRPSRHAAPQQS